MKKQAAIYTLIPLLFAAGLLSCSKDKGFSTPAGIKGDYSVFAWNDLGMHCLTFAF